VPFNCVNWIGQKIAALNSLEKNKAIVETPTRDTSQNGNFENFRNATYNGRPIALTSTWFINCPTAGRLHFDYVTTSRPVKGIRGMSANTFRRLTTMLFISHRKKDILRSLTKLTKGARVGTTTEGNTSGKLNQVNTKYGNEGMDTDSDEEEEEEEEESRQKAVRKSFARGGKTAVGKTLLQKLHIQRKRETLIEEKKKEGEFVGASEQEISEEVDRIMFDQSKKNSDTRQSMRRREAFSMHINFDQIGRQRLMNTAEEDSGVHKTGKGVGVLSVKRTENSFISWMYCIDSSWEATKASYTEYLTAHLKKAETDITKDDPYGILDPSYVNVM
jgi:hypothetical protein